MTSPSRTAFFFICALFAAPCQADFLSLFPLWEAGAGSAAFDVPDYRGGFSGRTGFYPPYPYFVNRGAFARSDRDRVRASLFESARLRVNLNVDGTLPAFSGGNPLPRGVAGQRAAIELGPTADIRLWDSRDRSARLELRAPLRAAMASETHPRDIGWIFSPSLSLDWRDPAGMPGWKVGAQAGPVFTSRHYNQYFYGVDAALAASGRSSYTAFGGYAGSRATLTVSKRFPRFWAGAFLRYDSPGGTAFNDSPLLEQRPAVAGGVAAAWFFGSSSMGVAAPD